MIFLVVRIMPTFGFNCITATEEDNASLNLIRHKGFGHEAAVLKDLETHCGPAVSISNTGALESRVSETLAAIASGAPLIYHGALANDRWVGFPDFLIRTGEADGVWLYEPEDAKLARKAKAEHLLQLGVYAALLNEAAGSPVAEGSIHVGASVFLDVFHRVEFGSIRRQADESDVFRDGKTCCDVISGTIEDQRGVRARS